MASVLEAQNSPPSSAQLDYLQSQVCGGMGTLNDVSFDPKLRGGDVAKINDMLERKREALCLVLREMLAQV